MPGFNTVACCVDAFHIRLHAAIDAKRSLEARTHARCRPEFRVRLHADRKNRDIGRNLAASRVAHHQAVGTMLDPLDFGTAEHLNTLTAQLVLDHAAELWIDSRKNG